MYQCGWPHLSFELCLDILDKSLVAWHPSHSSSAAEALMVHKDDKCDT